VLEQFQKVLRGATMASKKPKAVSKWVESKEGSVWVYGLNPIEAKDLEHKLRSTYDGRFRVIHLPEQKAHKLNLEEVNLARLKIKVTPGERPKHGWSAGTIRDYIQGIFFSR
jgi:hypothetical protein